MKLTKILPAVALFTAIAFQGIAYSDSACNKLKKKECTANKDCSWVKGYAKKDGTKVKGYCKAAKGKSNK